MQTSQMIHKSNKFKQKKPQKFRIIPNSKFSIRSRENVDENPEVLQDFFRNKQSQILKIETLKTKKVFHFRLSVPVLLKPTRMQVGKNTKNGKKSVERTKN